MANFKGFIVIPPAFSDAGSVSDAEIHGRGVFDYDSVAEAEVVRDGYIIKPSNKNVYA